MTFRSLTNVSQSRSTLHSLRQRSGDSFGRGRGSTSSTASSCPTRPAAAARFSASAGRPRFGDGIDQPRDDVADELDSTVADTDLCGVLGGRSTAVGSALGPAPSPRPEIGHIDGMGAEKEMVGTHATPLVAAMANYRLRRDGAVRDRPCQAVREMRLAVDCQMTVAAVRQAALPDQAAGQGIGLGQMGEALLGGPARREVAPPRCANGRGHGGRISAARLDHLLWAMAFAHSWKCASQNQVH